MHDALCSSFFILENKDLIMARVLKICYTNTYSKKCSSDWRSIWEIKGLEVLD